MDLAIKKIFLVKVVWRNSPLTWNEWHCKRRAFMVLNRISCNLVFGMLDTWYGVSPRGG